MYNPHSAGLHRGYHFFKCVRTVYYRPQFHWRCIWTFNETIQDILWKAPFDDGRRLVRGVIGWGLGSILTDHIVEWVGVIQSSYLPMDLIIAKCGISWPRRHWLLNCGLSKSILWPSFFFLFFKLLKILWNMSDSKRIVLHWLGLPKIENFTPFYSVTGRTLLKITYGYEVLDPEKGTDPFVHAAKIAVSEFLLDQHLELS